MFIREKIRFNGNDVNVKIPLGTNSNLNGLQESINEYIERETGLSINPATDGECFRIKLSLSQATFNFFFNKNNLYSNTLLNAGFTNVDFEEKSISVATSFFIMQVFDSMNTENQVLLHSGFYGGFNFSNAITTYNIASTNEFANLYISQSLLNSAPTNVYDVYAKFFFFNSKLGKLTPFYNEHYESLTTEQKLYIKIKIDRTTRLYQFIDAPSIRFKELVNANYNDSLNTTLDVFDNEKPTYPVGRTFTNNGTYQ